MTNQTNKFTSLLTLDAINPAAPLQPFGSILMRWWWRRLAIVFPWLLLAVQLSSQAQSLTVVTDPAGFFSLTVLSNSDTVISIPFDRPADFLGKTAAVTNNVIAVAGNPNWTPNQFVYAAGTQSNTYYAFINTGPAAGSYFTITNNTTNSLSLDLGSASLTNVGTGSNLAIIPFWTLGTALVVDQDIFDSPTPGNRFTEVLIPDFNGVGTNLSASRVYYHWNGNWREVGQGNAVKDDAVLRRDSYFILRQNLASNLLLTTFGMVPVRPVQIPLVTAASTKRDNSVALARPATHTLTESMLFESGAFSTSPATNARTDELLTFDNTVAQKNKTPAAIYYYWSNAWRQVGAGTNAVGSTPVFAPGTGVIVRKNATVGEPTYRWVNSPNY